MDASNVPARGNTAGVTITSDFCGTSYYNILKPKRNTEIKK